MMQRDMLGAILGTRPVARLSTLKFVQKSACKSAFTCDFLSVSSLLNLQKWSTCLSKSIMSLSTQSLFLKCAFAYTSCLVKSSVRTILNLLSPTFCLIWMNLAVNILMICRSAASYTDSGATPKIRLCISNSWRSRKSLVDRKSDSDRQPSLTSPVAMTVR